MFAQQAEPDTNTGERVLNIIADVWLSGGRDREAVDILTFDTILFDVLSDGTTPALGLDSLDAIEIGLRIDEEFEIALPEDVDPMDLRTPRQIALLVQRMTAEPT